VAGENDRILIKSYYLERVEKCASIFSA